MAIETLILEEAEPAVAQPAKLRGGSELSEEEITLLDILIILTQRKRMISCITAVFALGAVVVSLLLPVLYTATVTLIPPHQNSSVDAQLDFRLGSSGSMATLAGNGFGLRNPNAMYVAMFKSHTIEDSMISRFDLMREYRQRYLSAARMVFESRTKIDGSRRDGLIYISVEDSSPDRAAELANGYVQQFRDLSQHLAITEAAQRVLFFEQQLDQSKENLSNADESLVETEKKTGLIQVDSQARALIDSAASLNAQIAFKEMQIQGLQAYAAGENPQLTQADRELDSLRSHLARLGGAEDLSAGGIIVPKGLVPAASLEYIRRLRDVEYYDTISNILAQQLELAKLDEAKEGALIQVIDRALAPDRRSSPRRTPIVILATLVGFVVGILLALGQAAYRTMKDDPETSAKLELLRLAAWNK
jgi:tyrosine-protein kinase Etk/Wzc